MAMLLYSALTALLLVQYNLAAPLDMIRGYRNDINVGENCTLQAGRPDSWECSTNGPEDLTCRPSKLKFEDSLGWGYCVAIRPARANPCIEMPNDFRPGFFQGYMPRDCGPGKWCNGRQRTEQELAELAGAPTAKYIEVLCESVNPGEWKQYSDYRGQ